MLFRIFSSPADSCAGEDENGGRIQGGAGDENQTIDEQKVPLAAAETQKDGAEDALEAIADGEVPLAAAKTDQKGNMSWWWILVVAALGATGTELYRRHQKKPAKADNRKNG